MSGITKRRQQIGANGQTRWNRVVREVHNAMAEHLGGEAMITTPETLLIRRIAVFESEMRLMEAKIALDRQEKRDPDEKFLDLYSRLVNSQRRLLESVGMKRIPKDVTPSISEYIRATAKPAGASNPEEATEVTIDQTLTTEPPSQ
jgi:hypothetical protein